MEQPQALLDCELKLKIHDQDQEAMARLTDTALELKLRFGEVLTYSYRDIADINAEQYQVRLSFFGGANLLLFHLGKKYSDFVRLLIFQRNELIIADMLMNERVHRAGITAEVLVFFPDRQETLGPCELRLCDTALLIIPETTDPIRVPYSFLAEISEANYTVTIATEFGQMYSLSRMGRETEPFINLLSKLTNDLSVKAQTLLRELAPAVPPEAIHQAACLIREGRAAKRAALEQIDPALWKGLEQQLDAFGIRDEYLFLSTESMGQQCIGFKRELVAASASEYLWFLIPIPGNNLIAMEASSGPDSGRATYFFRILPRSEFKSLKPAQAAEKTDQILLEINRCMLAINFRREPIYLDDEKLQEPKYQKYLHSVRMIPGLKELRDSFVGRVFHRNKEQWEGDVKDLMSFNVSCGDDKKKWAKGDYESPDQSDENPEKGG